MATVNHTAHPANQSLTSTNQNSPLGQLDQAIEDLRFADLTIVTLASDIAVTPTLTGKSGKGVYNLTIAAQTGTSDDLIEVSGISVGDTVLLRADTGDTITVKHNDAGATIKIHCLSDLDFILNEQNPAMFVYVETNVLAQVTYPTAPTNSIAILRDEKTTATDGGSSSAATWNNRDLNTELYDPDAIVSIASNQFTPISGTYHLTAYAPVNESNVHRLRLYNVTGTASVQEGQVARASATDTTSSVAILDCVFTANGTDAYRIDHYTAAAKATNGLGVKVGDGSAEVYLVIILRKL